MNEQKKARVSYKAISEDLQLKVERLSSQMDEMAKEAETHTWTYEGLTEPHSLDSYISQLVEDKQEEKFLKKECRKNTLFRIPGKTYKDGEYDCIKVPYTPMVKDQVIKRYGKDVLILNESIN